MADIEWKPLPTGLWTPPAVFAEVGNLLLQAFTDDGYVTMGGPDEATYYVTECGPAWDRTQGAIAWLTKLATTLAPKRRTRTTMH